MLKEETSDGSNDGGNDWARVCDTCRSAACSVYCRADSAYLCADCDARIHAANRLASRHERVWVCEACERAPAAFLCKADAASLCASCDADIHSVNPLARRHQRVPILPISGSLYGPPANDQGRQELRGAPDGKETLDGEDEDEDEAASWLLPNPAGKNSTNQNTGFLFGSETDQYLEVNKYNSNAENQHNNQYQEQQQHYSFPQKNYGGGDSVVPVQYGDVMNQYQQQQHQEYQFGIECGSSKSLFSYNGSFGHSTSISSMEGGVVPETTTSDYSISLTQTQMPTQLTPMDREARVLRYREKKKTRKFEKTIRYASRKAYAETRPRIKGRFAKRSEVEVEADQMFSTTLMRETGYGIVPSF